MTTPTVPQIRPARQRRPGAREKSGWQVPFALIILSLIPVISGSRQFSARLRRRHLNWHRRTGRILVGVGLAVAVSGLWMTLFYSGAPGGDLLWAIRLLVGSTMAAAIVLGFTAIRRRNIAAHRAWMMRAYALGLGAGTQAFTEGIGEALFGTTDLSKAISLGSGWAINAVVAEWVIRRPYVHRARRAPTRAALAAS
jgi:uncharacterized membrane protein